MTDLKIAVATSGPVPDPQCALKDAVIMAAAAGITDPAAVTALARDFYAFLVNPSGGTPHAPAAVVAPPAPEHLGMTPLENGQPVVNVEPAAPVEPAVPATEAAPSSPPPAPGSPPPAPEAPTGATDPVSPEAVVAPSTAGPDLPADGSTPVAPA